MSTGLGEGGRRGREFFLSTHRCPEVELLPHHVSKTQIPPPCSLVPVKSSEFTCTGQSEANYLDDSEEEEEEEEEEESISDWSEEDLSFHFSPSVILPSEVEESDSESSFECIDVTMEMQVKGQKGEAVKMVPKRLIQMKKKNAENVIDQKTEKLQVILKDGLAQGGGAKSELSANELLCPTVCHCPDLLLRQHSMPAYFHTHSTTSSDVDSNRVSQAPRQPLLKSFSLDETKTKMASCIIKDVLSKKMQVEQNNCQSFNLQKKPAQLPGLPQPADQQRVREGERGETSCLGGETSSLGGETGRSVVKAPVHVVRDMRSLVKNTYSLSFSTAATTPENKPTSFKVIGQDDSPPPTYQQAVGIKGHDETNGRCPASVYFYRRHLTKVAASLSQSNDRQHSDRFNHPITKQRRGSEPIVSRRKVDVTCPTNPPISRDLSQFSQSERGRGVSHQAGTPPPFIQPPLSAQEQGTMLGVSSQSAPSSSKQILHSCFYPPTLHPHLEKVNYMNIQSQLQPPPPVLTHLLRRSEEIWLAGNTSDHLDQLSNGNTLTPATQKQHEQQTPQQQLQQQHFLCRVQGFLPAQVGSDFLVDIPPGAVLSGTSPYHMMLEPKSGRYIYVNTPLPPQMKMLLDPETGQYIQVFLPAARSFPHTDMIPVLYAKPAPVMISSAPILSVMQFQPTVAVSSLYTTAPFPFTLHPHQLTSHIQQQTCSDHT